MNDLSRDIAPIEPAETSRIPGPFPIHFEGDDVAPEAIGGRLGDLPKGYYYTPRFLGTFFATITAMISGYASFNLPSGVLNIIGTDLGDPKDVFWVSIVWTIGFAVGTALVGRLSDIFGRRYFFIGASVLALIGNIIASRAQNVDTLSGAMGIMGLSAGGQLSYNIVLGELVPNRDRGLFNGFGLAFTAPFSIFAPVVIRSLIENTEQRWRWGFYIGIMINFTSCILWIVFYHPPSYEMLHVHGRSKWAQLKRVDWIGAFLFTGGLTVFLLGVSRGGVVYPWRSVQVLAPFFVGLATLVALCLWEAFAKLESPLLPMSLFKRLDYVVIVVVATVGVMIYYAMLVLWPLLVGTMYETKIMRIAWVSVSLSGSLICGQMLGGVGLRFIPRMDYQMLISSIVMVAFTGALAAANPTNEAFAIGMVILAAIASGYVENLCYSTVALVWEPADIGLVSGVMAAIRTAGGSLAISMYSSILGTELTKNLPKKVIPAATSAGLPETSIPTLMGQLSSGNLSSVPGITPQIMQAVGEATKWAYASSFRIVFLSTIPWGAVMIALAWFCPKMDDKLTDEVSRKLQTAGSSTQGKAGDVEHVEKFTDAAEKSDV